MSEIPHHFKVGDKRVGDEQGDSRQKKRLKVSLNQLCGDPKIVLKHRNYLQFLSNRELGVTGGVQAKKEVYQIKTLHKEKTSTSVLPLPISYDSCEVHFINGDDKSFFAVWCVNNDGNEYNDYIMAEIDCKNDDCGDYTVGFWEPIDMCRAPTGFEPIYNLSRPSAYYFDPLYADVKGNEDDLKQWNCCCFLDDAVAYGANGFITIVFAENNYYQRRVPGNVSSLSYRDQTILLGLETGHFYLMDRREMARQRKFKLSNKAINDTMFLNDQEVIVSNTEGHMVKVDLRMEKMSAKFFGHKHSVTKRPFSVANDMLCATGRDNTVRIWHISGGHPIHVEKSTSGHQVRGWLQSDGNKTYLNYFERDTKTVFTI